MDWIDGVSLYEWAREHAPTSQQMRRVLAQLARALQATHAARCVHRDVKGDNVVVRRSDSRAMLVDFGSGCYEAAARVTWQSLPPGTPAYQSPELGLFQIRAVRDHNAHYQAKPSDDVYALGVTAYRLVTGEYPPSAGAELDEEGTWHLKEVLPPDPRSLNPRVEPELSALILRMLRLLPEARGTAAEVAEALEKGLEGTKRERAAVRARLARAMVLVRLPARLPRSVVTVAGLLLAFIAGQVVQVMPDEERTVRAGASGAGASSQSPASAGEQAPAEHRGATDVQAGPHGAEGGQPGPSTEASPGAGDSQCERPPPGEQADRPQRRPLGGESRLGRWRVRTERL